MNDKEKKYIRTVFNDPANQDTHIDILTREVLSKFPHLDFEEVRKYGFNSLLGIV